VAVRGSNYYQFLSAPENSKVQNALLSPCFLKHSFIN